MNTDTDSSYGAVDTGPVDLVCVGGPHCGESLKFPAAWDGCLAPRGKALRHYFHAGKQFKESKEGILVMPLMDRRHRYERMEWRGREMLIHSDVESSR